MHINEKYVARIFLQLRIHECNGSAFEKLFTDIMRYAHKDFIQIKPQGAKGDRGNDGYHPSAGHYFQVYAPENPADMRERGKAATKAATDFKKLRHHWHTTHPINRYSFVFNDKYLGSFEEIEKACEKIKKDHGLAESGSFCANNLEDKFFALADDEIFAIVGAIPNPDTIQSLDYSVLGDVIKAVHDASSTVKATSTLTAPEFDAKITFNGLGELSTALLKVANIQSGSLSAYFKRNSTFAKQTLRDELNQLYLNTKATTVADTTGSITHGDLVFFELLR